MLCSSLHRPVRVIVHVTVLRGKVSDINLSHQYLAKAVQARSTCRAELIHDQHHSWNHLQLLSIPSCREIDDKIISERVIHICL